MEDGDHRRRRLAADKHTHTKKKKKEEKRKISQIPIIRVLNTSTTDMCTVTVTYNSLPGCSRPDRRGGGGGRW